MGNGRRRGRNARPAARASNAPNVSHSTAGADPVNASCEPVPVVGGDGAPPAVTPGAPVVVGPATVVVGAGVAAFTITVPTMFECTRQWYANVPAVVNVCEKVPPGLMHGPVGQVGLESNAPVFDVTLWIDCPVFVQTTVVPAVTVIDEGENPKSTIETGAVAAGDGAGGAGVTVVGTGANGSVSVAVVVEGAATVVVVDACAGCATNAGAVRVRGAAAAAGAIASRSAPRQPAPATVKRRQVPPIIGGDIRTVPAMRSPLPA